MEHYNASQTPLVPNFPFKTGLESSFQSLGLEDFVQRNYHHSIYYVALYLTAIHLGQSYMKKRPAMDLTLWLAVWNWTLAAVSLAGTLRTVPELVHSLRHFGLDHTICNDRYYYISSVMFFWCQITVLCKALELLDTLFVVLRKRKLLFLHWFHHSSVLVFTWVIAKDRCAITRWYMAMNYPVHALMYAYFALRTMKFRLPRSMAVFITTAQILQMVMGLFVSLHGLNIWYRGRECSVSGRVAVLGAGLYTLYFMMFIRFFVHTYITPRLRKKVD